MRVILEMTEAEGRTLTIERRLLDGETAAPTAFEETPKSVPADGAGVAVDGGPPSAALLYALGASVDASSEDPAASPIDDGVERNGGLSAGAAPDWLSDILRRGGRQA